MTNINILDKTIFNRIAAGEVVERPASIVKELVENSIDAGATNITIEVTDGGIKRIRITDNGSGMTAENLPKAFMPHATSKITTLDDLDKIGTLGFRGEALSSISSVSRVVAISKTRTDDTGSRIEIEGGEVLSLTPYGASNGTAITIDDIFFNVPARAKFLKKPKQEESEITNIVSRLILANPNIVFKYIANERIVFLSNGNDLKDAIYTVYGKNFVDNIIPVSFKRDIFKFDGFVGKPTFSKPNRTYQTLLINGRYVINQQIATAIYKAYEGFLMKGNFPFFVLNLTIPLDKIDVNVHPNKLDVKFEESNKIFGIILSGIGDVLLSNSHVKYLENDDLYNENSAINIAHIQKAPTTLVKNEGYSFGSDTKQDVNITDLGSEILTNSEYQSEAVLFKAGESFAEDVSNGVLGQKNLVDISKDDAEYKNKQNSLSYFLNNNGHNYQVKTDNGFSDSLANQALGNDNIIRRGQENAAENVSMFTDLAYKVVGIIFNTYVIVEQDSIMYMIDQHAAHERILYDKFKSQLESREVVSQQLLVPYVLDLNYLESEFVKNNISAFTEVGFEIEDFGVNSYKISSVPVLFKDVSIQSFFNVILKDINTKVSIKSANIIEEYLARSACRTAIKANDKISDIEIEKLLNDLNKSGQVLLCPHGRPVVVKIPKLDIEKWFKRIV